MTPRTPGVFELLGLEGPEFDLAARWDAHDGRSRDLRVPIGFDASGAIVSLDFSRWSSLDDHVLVVGAPGAGTTTLLRTLLLSLSITHHPSHAGIFVVEGKAGGQEYAEVDSGVPHCRGHVTFAEDRREWTVHRLTQALAGEVDRRERLLQSAGVASIERYRDVLRANPVDSPSRADVPETFVLIDNFSWLQGEDFDRVVRLLAAHGHRLGLRMVVGVPYSLWESLEPANYFSNFTARVALGLPRRQAAAVLGADVPDDLGSPGDAYVRWLGAQPIRVAIATADTPV
ncbi:FtsK/SpoIIIE domain-containing protein [Mycobacterium sp. DBP42]|uniref:FtsK/SpoIIIE domain-containing protein n=1 Tax=Mycobacteriaceae TaxID=1762 RepID=UPI00148626A8|nr:FtsK/SpoIIIE domain-containing protein [Mycobacterium sp. DBP42]